MKEAATCTRSSELITMIDSSDAPRRFGFQLYIELEAAASDIMERSATADKMCIIQYSTGKKKIKLQPWT